MKREKISPHSPPLRRFFQNPIWRPDKRFTGIVPGSRRIAGLRRHVEKRRECREGSMVVRPVEHNVAISCNVTQRALEVSTVTDRFSERSDLM